jgi:hypothetical protein
MQQVQLHLLHQCTWNAGAVVQQQHTLVLLHQLHHELQHQT